MVEEKQFQFNQKAKEIRRNQRDLIRNRQNSLEEKFKQIDEHVEANKKEKEHEVMMKKEVRKLREEDFKLVSERLKRKDTLKKLYILEKEFGVAESIEKAKQERERLAEINAERHRQQSVERLQLENALAQLTHLQSTKARERFLKNKGFDQSFIQKIKQKLPMLLEPD